MAYVIELLDGPLAGVFHEVPAGVAKMPDIMSIGDASQPTGTGDIYVYAVDKETATGTFLSDARLLGHIGSHVDEITELLPLMPLHMVVWIIRQLFIELDSMTTQGCVNASAAHPLVQFAGLMQRSIEIFCDKAGLELNPPMGQREDDEGDEDYEDYEWPVSDG